MKRRAQKAARAGGVPQAYPLPTDSAPEPLKPADIAGYIADMTDELSKMAAAGGFEAICYLLTLARLEAETVAQGCEDK